MRQTCDDHARYVAGCEGCIEQKRVYQRARREAERGTQGPNANAAGPHIDSYRIPAPGSWADLAACKGHLGVMFPRRPKSDRDGAGYTSYRSLVRQAKALCAGCPVLAECAAYIGRWPTQSGIWAGTTEDERQAIRRQR